MKVRYLSLISAFLALQAQGDTVVLTFSNPTNNDGKSTHSIPSFSTDNWELNSAGAGQSYKSEHTKTLSDGCAVTLNLSKGKFWNEDQPTGTTWTNSVALGEMNATLGTSLITDDLSGMTYIASAAGGASAPLTFNFVNNSTDYKIGDSVVFYIAAVSPAVSYTSLTITGLSNTDVQWATNGGNGFTESGSFAQGTIGLIKVTGTLSAGSVVLANTEGRNGWGMVAYTIVPEPTTATLSLLALAGLCSRRRRRK